VYKTYIWDFFIFWKFTELCRFVTYLSDDPHIFGRNDEHILWDNMYIGWSVCVCGSADKSNENTDGEGSVVEEETVTVQFVSRDLNVCHSFIISLMAVISLLSSSSFVFYA